MKTTAKPARRPARRRVFFVSVVRLQCEGADGATSQTPLLEVCVEAPNERTALDQVRQLYPDLVPSGKPRPADHLLAGVIRKSSQDRPCSASLVP